MKLSVVTIFCFVAVFATQSCKKVNQDSTVSSNSADEQGQGTLSYQCVVDNYAFEGTTNFKNCPKGIRFAASDFESYNTSINVEFTCFVSSEKTVQETITLVGSKGKWTGKTVETVDGEDLSFELTGDKSGQVVFENLPLSVACSSYDYLPTSE